MSSIPRRVPSPSPVAYDDRSQYRSSVVCQAKWQLLVCACWPRGWPGGWGSPFRLVGKSRGWLSIGPSSMGGLGFLIWVVVSKIFLIFIPTWGNDPNWLIFFKWVGWNHQLVMIKVKSEVVLLMMSRSGWPFLEWSWRGIWWAPPRCWKDTLGSLGICGYL